MAIGNLPSGNEAEYVLRIKAELDTSLQRSIDQMANLRGELNTLSRTISQQSAALKAAGGDTALYEQSLAALKAQYQSTSTAAQGFNTATAGTTTASRGSIDAIRAVSTQLGDFGVQVSSGTSALTAFSQQFPQLLGQLGVAATGFTGIGIAIGVLVTSFAPLILKLFEAKNATEEYEKASKGLQSALADVGKAGREFSFDSLIKQYNAADTKTRELIVNQVRLQQAIIETARVQAQQALKATAPSINLGAFGGAPTTGVEGVAGGFNPMATQQQTLALREQAQNTALVADAQKRLGIETEGAARQFVALRSAFAKGNIDAATAARSLREIVTANKSLTPALAEEVQRIQTLIVAEQDYANAIKSSNKFLKDSADLQAIPVDAKGGKSKAKAVQDYQKELKLLELQLLKMEPAFGPLAEFEFKLKNGLVEATEAEADRARALLVRIELEKETQRLADLAIKQEKERVKAAKDEADIFKRQNDVIIEAVKLQKELQDKRIKSIRDQIAASNDLEQKTQDVENKVQDFINAYAEGIITFEQLRLKTIELYGTLENTTKIKGVSDILTENFNSFFENLQKGTADASDAFKRMAQSIVAQLARLALNKIFVALLNGAFGGGFGIGASGAIQIGGPRSMGSVGSSGDMLRSIGSIPSIRDGSSTGISSSSSSSDSLVNVNVVNNTASQVSVQDEGNGNISVFIDQVKQSIARDIGQGTGMAKTFERVYGVGRYAGAI